MTPQATFTARIVGGNSTARLILIVLLILLLCGMLPAWPYSMGWGFYPSGGLGLVILVVLILVLVGKL